jgi:hypothetical protein
MAGAPNANLNGGINGNGFYPQPNGISAQQQNGAAGGVIMPSAGHFADMATLMSSMETLSGWLQQNREEWAGLQEGLARVERAQERHSALGLNNGLMGPLPASLGEHEGTNGELPVQLRMPCPFFTIIPGALVE